MNREIIEFLIRAKKATYAGKGAETAPSRTGSHDLVYKDGDHAMADLVNMHVYEDYISVSFDVGTPEIMSLGEKMNEICDQVYMNGYNWDDKSSCI